MTKQPSLASFWLTEWLTVFPLMFWSLSSQLGEYTCKIKGFIVFDDNKTKDQLWSLNASQELGNILNGILEKQSVEPLPLS